MERGLFPLDRQLALRDKHWSEGVARQAVRLSGLLPFEQAAEVLAELGQIAISTGSVWQLSAKWGEQIKAQEEARQEQAKAIPTVPRREERVEGVAPRLGVAMDGVLIYIRGEEWKELKTGCVFEVEPRSVVDKQTGERMEVGHAVRNSYVGYLGGPEVFGERLWAEAQGRGWTAAADSEVIGDGALWIWNLAGEHFYTSLQVVDWYHGVEHLARAAGLVHGEGTPGARRWLKKQETVLYQGDAAQIAQSLTEIAQGKSESGAELLKEATYFEHNKRRMDYLEMRAAGWVIGSGMIESGGKQFKARFVGPGMRWSRSGAERLIPIRAEIMNHRFDQCWQSVYNSPPN